MRSKFGEDWVSAPKHGDRKADAEVEAMQEILWRGKQEQLVRVSDGVMATVFSLFTMLPASGPLRRSRVLHDARPNNEEEAATAGPGREEGSTQKDNQVHGQGVHWPH